MGNSYQDAAARLKRLLAENDPKQLLRFGEDMADKEHPNIKWSVYGEVTSDEILVKVTNGTVTFVEAVRNRGYPALKNMLFGLDVAAEHQIKKLTDRMWKKHQGALLGRGTDR